ncbi:MAG: TetR/AcrR family transcriptional regulator, partial [Demequina sp.]
MTKGSDTRARVLAQGIDLASEWGLESLTIGTLADRSGLSKSGLYAHFTSKEDMQCQVLDAAAIA